VTMVTDVSHQRKMQKDTERDTGYLAVLIPNQLVETAEKWHQSYKSNSRGSPCDHPCYIVESAGSIRIDDCMELARLHGESVPSHSSNLFWILAARSCENNAPASTMLRF
jgi:hypothetical protein